MITKHSLALAENIAVAMNGDTRVRQTPILTALTDVSYGYSDYTENFRNEIPDVTANITEHTDVMRLGVERMGEIMRGALDMVKTYGVPLAQAICSGLSCAYRTSDLPYLAMQKTEIKYTNIDDPFFASQIYPNETQVRNTALSFQGVSLAALSRLKFQYLTDSELFDFVGSNHPDVVAVLKDEDESLGMAFEKLTSLQGLGELLVMNGAGVVDFTQVRDININMLLKMFVLIGRMYLSEKPLGLEDGSLKDYREFVELMYNGMIVYLSRLKKMVDMYRARGLVLRNEKQPEIVEHLDNSTGQKLFLLSFKAYAFYTNDTIALAEANGVGLNDVVYAAQYSTAMGNPVGTLDLVKDKARVEGLLKEYYGKIDLVMTRKAKEIFTNVATAAAVKFVADRPELRQALDANLKTENAMTATIISEHLGSELQSFYGRYAAAAGGAGGGAPVSEQDQASEAMEVLFQTRLIPVFLRMLGCELAAEIIEHTYVTQSVEDNITDKRERLHVALIEVLASKLIEV